MTAEEMEVEAFSDPAATQKLEPYAPGPNAVDVTPDKDGGVLKEIKREGTGDETPPAGSKVSVHYVGTLTDGTKFDSSRDRGQKFEFDLGKGSVIKAWDVGVATMKRGEVAVFLCKANYAYGESGSPPKIPPNADLVFEVELFDWKLEDLSKKKDGGILRRILRKGEGYSMPNEGSLVEVHIVGKHEGRVFDERDVSFTLGEGSDHNIPEGVETALQKFKNNEKSLVDLKPSYAFGNTGNETFQIPPNASVSYEIELKKFEKAKETWSMDADEKLEQSKLCKDKGTNYFKAAKYSLALKQYKKIVDFLESEKSVEGDKAKEREALLLASYLNQAMCYLKQNEFVYAKNICDKALGMDPTNEKGLFRRGQAQLSLHEPESAKKDFEAILKVDLNNKAAANQVLICNARIKEQREKERKLYAGIFAKMAETEKQVGSQWRYGWWDESQKNPQLEVDLEKVEREKEERLKQERLARRREYEDLFKKKVCAKSLVQNVEDFPQNDQLINRALREGNKDMPEPTHWEGDADSPDGNQVPAGASEVTTESVAEQ